MSWIGVDLDGTLAHYDQWISIDHIGEPIPAMVQRVKTWRAAQICVKIFTARMHGHGIVDLAGVKADCITPIQDWCLKHLGEVLEVTNVKDFGMIELWDDRAIQVQPNTGRRIAPLEEREYICRCCGLRQDPLSVEADF